MRKAFKYCNIKVHAVINRFIFFVCFFPFLFVCVNRVKVLECSAKDDANVTDLFKTMLSLSRILPPGTNDQQPTTGLKRRSSAYVSATSKGKYYFPFDVRTYIRTAIITASCLVFKLEYIKTIKY